VDKRTVEEGRTFQAYAGGIPPPPGSLEWESEIEGRRKAEMREGKKTLLAALEIPEEPIGLKNIRGEEMSLNKKQSWQ
jgi:hypothetical protein